MENKKLIVEKHDKEFVVKKMRTFLWNLDSENVLNEQKIELNFSRDDSLPYLTNIKEIEQNFKDKIIPLWLCIAPVILAFILFTTFFICFLVDKANFDKVQGFLVFFIPGGLLMILAVFLVNKRMNQMREFINNKDILLKKAQNKVEEIIQKYGTKEN